MLIKYIKREYYSIDDDFNLSKIIKSLAKRYPSDRFVLESATKSEYGDEMIIKISQALPAGTFSDDMSFEIDNDELYG